MEESILNSIKQLLGPDSSYDVFDQDILIHINMALSILTQHGVGPSRGFRVEGPSETWEDFLGDSEHIDMIKTYVYMKVKMAFDPPSSSFVMSAMEDTCRELEWRMYIDAELN